MLASRMTLLLLALVMATPLRAQTPPSIGLPITMKVMAVDVTVEPNGQYVAHTRMEIQAANDAAAKAIGQAALPYVQSTSNFKIDEAYTLKKSGEKVPVQSSAILDQSPIASTNLAMFNDIRRKTIVFPNVEAGDSIVYATTTHMHKPELPNAFFGAWYFPKIMPLGTATITIKAPRSMRMTIDALGAEVQQSSTKDLTTYSFQYTAPPPVPSEDPTAIISISKVPRFAISSFESYPSLATTYAKSALQKAKPTATVRATVERITAGATDDRAQARAIYDWVSHHIRYVSIAMGTGSIIPHDPDVTLKNGYGDCKDKAVLLTALLTAKGIPSELVLINAGLNYELSQAPSFAELNHMINWLPTIGVYLDTTAEVAPFGILSLSEYGKPAVHVTNSDAPVRTTPLPESNVTSVTLKTISQMDSNYRLVGRTTTTATGPYAIALRRIGLGIESSGPERAAASYFQTHGLKGSGRLEVQADTTQDSYSISGTFDEDAKPQTASVWMSIPAGYRLMGFTGDGLAGPLFATRLPDTAPTPCFSGKQSEELSLALPAEITVKSLPSDANVHTPNLDYRTHWTHEGRYITVKREFNTHFDDILCKEDIRATTAGALEQIRKIEQEQVFPSPEPVATEIEDFKRVAEADTGNPVGSYNLGYAYFRSSDYMQAIAALSEAIRIDPAYWAARVERASAYMVLSGNEKSRLEAALGDWNEAIKLNAASAPSYRSRGQVHLALGEKDAAKEDFAAAIRLAPLDPTTYANMARADCDVGPFARVNGIAKTSCVRNEYIQALTGAINKEKHTIPLYTARAKARLEMGAQDLAEAKADIDVAEALNAEDVDVKFTKALYLIRMNQPQNAIALLDKFIEQSDPAVIDNRLSNPSVVAKIDPHVLAAIKGYNNPKRAEFIELRARAHIAMNQQKDALADTERVLAIDPKRTNMISYRAWILMRMHKYPEAIAGFSRALELVPNDPYALEFRGVSYEGNGQFKEALADYKKVLELAPDHPDIHTMISEAQNMAEKPSLAKNHVERQSAAPPPPAPVP